MPEQEHIILQERARTGALASRAHLNFRGQGDEPCQHTGLHDTGASVPTARAVYDMEIATTVFADWRYVLARSQIAHPPSSRSSLSAPLTARNSTALRVIYRSPAAAPPTSVCPPSVPY
jgi:hypothetical protein